MTTPAITDMFKRHVAEGQAATGLDGESLGGFMALRWMRWGWGNEPDVIDGEEGAPLPPGAISGTDGGETVYLDAYDGGAGKYGHWGRLTLRFEQEGRRVDEKGLVHPFPPYNSTHIRRYTADDALGFSPLIYWSAFLLGAGAAAGAIGWIPSVWWRLGVQFALLAAGGATYAWHWSRNR